MLKVNAMIWPCSSQTARSQPSSRPPPLPGNTQGAMPPLSASWARLLSNTSAYAPRVAGNPRDCATRLAARGWPCASNNTTAEVSGCCSMLAMTPESTLEHSEESTPAFGVAMDNGSAGE